MDEVKPNQMKIVDPRSATTVEPHLTCTFEQGMSSAELFPSRSVESFQMFVERMGPRMKAMLDDTMLTATYENVYYPIDDYYTLNGDGLLSVCMRVHDEGHWRRRHEIATYDHVTKELKTIGSIPRHRFEMDVDCSVLCMNDPAFVEGVIGALTHDSNFLVVLAHSKKLRTVSVFDIANATCLLEKECTKIDFLKCGPNGIALNPKGIPQGRFEIAIVNDDMEVRLWNAITLAENAVQLEDIFPSFGTSRYLINPRESALKFTPDGRFLCVLGYLGTEKYSACILLDGISLEPFCTMPYGTMLASMSSVFPCFTTCGTKLAMFSVPDHWLFMVLEEYRLLFFEIPPRMEPLKNLCRLAVLSSVDNSKLSKLPLPSDLIAYLSGNTSGSTSVSDKKKSCNLM